MVENVTSRWADGYVRSNSTIEKMIFYTIT